MRDWGSGFRGWQELVFTNHQPLTPSPRFQVLYNQLQPCFAAPGVWLDGIGEFDALAGHESSPFEFFDSVPPDGFEWSACLITRQTQLQMLLFHHARLSRETQVARHKERARVASSKRLKSEQLSRQRKRESFRRQLRINVENRNQIITRQVRSGVFV